ncbi:hypothetical protein, partial [Schaalia vaccimaxillae]|uniref:hypothetical protein n=1 Tax=Schaalia vaccimaxillae TaxID=183916 RepID=UPI00047A8777
MGVDQLGLWAEKTPEPAEIGPVEAGYIKQMETLEKNGVMGAEHAGTRSLVLTAARAVDQIKPTDAASGRSNLLKALNDIAQRLPEPSQAGGSVIDELRALL